MKRLTGSSPIVIVLALILLPVSALALTSGDWEYIEEGGGATITGYTGAVGDVVIPLTVGETIAVFKIGNEAFKDNLKSEGIPCRTVSTTGCLRKKILEHTSRRSDIDFVVVESSEELDIQCEEETRSLKDFIASLRIPLVVISETQGMA